LQDYGGGIAAHFHKGHDTTSYFINLVKESHFIYAHMVQYKINTQLGSEEETNAHKLSHM
jgi:hypothetical protein